VFEIALPQVIQTQTKPSMSKDTTRQSVLFTELAQRPVTVAFDQPDSSSDGGALLLKGCDQTLGLSTALAACLSDTRHPDRISHTLHDLLRQRRYGLACGYEDCNDARRLKEEFVQK